MDIAVQLDALVPAAEYRGSLTDNTEAAYEAIVWEDNRPKPTWDDVISVTLTISVDKLIEMLKASLYTLPVESRDKFYASGDIPAVLTALREGDIEAAVYRLRRIPVDGMTEQETAVYTGILSAVQSL